MKIAYDHPSMNPLSPMHLRLCQLNCENLFIHLEGAREVDLDRLNEKEWQRLNPSTVPNKSLRKIKWLASALLEIDADIVILAEVGGRESLDHFAARFLGETYRPLLLEGNSDRGIDVGYLVKHSLSLNPLLISHRSQALDFVYPHEDPLQSTPHFFSRDALELRLFRPDDYRPALILLACHLKSKLDPGGVDPEGRLRRAAEANALAKVYRRIRSETPETPVVVAGDFNGRLRSPNPDPEFKELLATDLVDTLSSLGVSEMESATQIQFSRQRGREATVIDYILSSPHLKNHLILEGSRVHLFKNEKGESISWPMNLDQRLALPSDHYPVVVNLRLPIS